MNEILQQRIEFVQAGRNTTHAQIEAKRSLREQLDSDLEAFLKTVGRCRNYHEVIQVNFHNLMAIR